MRIEHRHRENAAMKRFWAALTVQKRVIHALMLREMLTTFGREHLGVFWLMGEPLLLTLAVMGMWTMWGHERQSSVGVIPFALSAYTLITLWRHLVFRLMLAARHNVSLMFHRNVHHLDTLITRVLLECGGIGLSFSAIYVFLYVIGAIDPIYDPFKLVAGFMLAAWFSTGTGLAIAGATQMLPLLERFVSPFMYVTLPLTGFVYMLSWLPDSVARIASYSPLVNCFELFRDGLFGHQVEAQWDFVYTAKVNLVLTAIGLMLVHKAQGSLEFE